MISDRRSNCERRRSSAIGSGPGSPVTTVGLRRSMRILPSASARQSSARRAAGPPDAPTRMSNAVQLLRALGNRRPGGVVDRRSPGCSRTRSCSAAAIAANASARGAIVLGRPDEIGGAVDRDPPGDARSTGPASGGGRGTAASGRDGRGRSSPTGWRSSPRLPNSGANGASAMCEARPVHRASSPRPRPRCER